MSFQFIDLPDCPAADDARVRVVKTLRLAKPLDFAAEDLAFAFPGSVGGLRYCLEIGATRQTAGAIEARKNLRSSGPVRSYLATAFVDGSTLEIVEGSDTPNLFRIYRDALEIGAIEIAEYRKVLAVALPWRWNISLGDRTFGTVERSMVVNADSLCIDRLGGGALPLRAARVDSLMSAVEIMLRMFTPAGLLLPRPTNGDLVLRQHDTPLGEAERWVYFAASVYFRTLAFDLDFD